ncbi:MAG: hypothetical protein PHS53_00550 [Candidatus Pacebacteria bacterium]|nr:hypothetical protein [Candidatus Paceibacterota bacterium]MDD5356626.1 hypothetical protein [Candidatus Paceibacterota bacterium]
MTSSILNPQVGDVDPKVGKSDWDFGGTSERPAAVELLQILGRMSSVDRSEFFSKRAAKLFRHRFDVPSACK